MLVACAAYQDGRKVADISVEEIRAALTSPGSFVWVALKDPEPAELAQLQDVFALHELAIEDAQQGHQRPKLEEYGASLFVVMHTIELKAEEQELQTGEIAVFVGRNYVVSVRRGTKQGFVNVRRRSEEEP